MRRACSGRRCAHCTTRTSRSAGVRAMVLQITDTTDGAKSLRDRSSTCTDEPSSAASTAVAPKFMSPLNGSSTSRGRYARKAAASAMACLSPMYMRVKSSTSGRRCSAAVTAAMGGMHSRSHSCRYSSDIAFGVARGHARRQRVTSTPRMMLALGHALASVGCGRVNVSAHVSRSIQQRLPGVRFATKNLEGYVSSVDVHGVTDQLYTNIGVNRVLIRFEMQGRTVNTKFICKNGANSYEVIY